MFGKDPYQTTDDSNVVVLVESSLEEDNRKDGCKQHLSTSQHLHSSYLD